VRAAAIRGRGVGRAVLLAGGREAGLGVGFAEERVAGFFASLAPVDATGLVADLRGLLGAGFSSVAVSEFGLDMPQYHKAAPETQRPDPRGDARGMPGARSLILRSSPI